MEIISSSPRNIQEKEFLLLQNPKSSPTPPQTPRSQENAGANSSSYPTTFVQADTSNFKQVVQLLTGASTKAAAGGAIPPIKTTPQKKQGFKLHERRNNLKNGLMVNTYAPPNKAASLSPRIQADVLLSPSILDFPSLVLSPITPPLAGERSRTHNSSATETNLPSSEGEGAEEEKAITEKKFYLHLNPSPRSKDGEPQLLALFPLTSPRVAESPPSSATTS